MFINQLFESAYSDGVSDGIQGRANPRASSIYGPESNEYHRGYADGVVKGKEQKQARVAQAKADEEPYEQMSTEELNQLKNEIQQRSEERQKIYSRISSSTYGIDKSKLPANHAELMSQNKADNKAWNIIHQVLWQRKQQGISEAGSPAQQAAIAIAMKKAHKKPKSKGVAEVSDRDPGALASRAHIASQERKHQAWDEKQKQLEKEFYANHPELDDRHKTVDRLVKEFDEMLSRTK